MDSSSKQQRRKLLLIDGNAILHRAFHALPPLTNKEGQLSNAVYGFFSMLLTILKDQKPDNLIVCFDRPKPTFRQELFVGYHKHRPKMSDDLIPQIGVVHEVLHEIGVNIFEVDGYEADDLIGTLVTQAKISFEVLILTGDRDLLQLVDTHVTVLAPLIGVKQITVYNVQKVEEKFGVTPKQFIDYKALIGDPSDGYPGVAGIGPKTAADLLKRFGSFENLYLNLGDVSPKTAALLATDAEQAALAKKLATIVTDAPVTFNEKKCQAKEFDFKKGQEAFEKLGFKSLITRLESLEKGDKSSFDATQDKQDKDDNEQLGFL